MKNFKNLTFIIGVLFAFMMISCDKDETTEIIAEQQFDVVFDINNFNPGAEGVSGKNIFLNGRDSDGLPECSDKEPFYVQLTINQGEMQTLKLVTLNNKTETEVLKLAPGDYNLTSFVVYSEDNTVLWAAPMEGSYYQELWGLTGVYVPFTVLAFDKIKVNVDVLCYEPYNYEAFGFVWFAYAAIEIHTICFFGDICTKFYDYFHKEGSPYYEQSYAGYDFPAIFHINIRNEAGKIVNDNRSTNGIFKNSNKDWLGVGQPLCIEYPDQVGVDELFTFEIMLAMPDGSWKLIHTDTFNDTMMSDAGNPEGFGGIDGIYDFVVGNCSYDGNNGNYEMPPYLPLPKTGMFMVNESTSAYFNVNFIELDDQTLFQNGGPGYPAFCGDINHEIEMFTWYNAEFWSSLEIDTIPEHFNTYKWGALNWLVNNMESYPELSRMEIQGAIWYVIHGDHPDLPPGSINPLALDALNNLEFIPTVGDYAIVLVHDVLSNPASSEGSDDVQLVLVRVDP